MISRFDYFYDEARYGWVVDKHYDWINMLHKMKNNNPTRFKEFSYSEKDIYHHLDRLSQEQYLYD